MRQAIVGLFVLYAAILGLGVLMDMRSHSDPAGEGLEDAIVGMFFWVTLICGLPALLLALLGVGRALHVALGISLVPAIFGLLLFALF